MANAQLRRQFLKFLVASPLLGWTTAGRLLADEMLDTISLPDYLIKSPDEALDVFDFHNVARSVLPTAHYGYLATGTDGNETLKANRKAFDRVYLRAMRMVDTAAVSLDTRLLDEPLTSPIVLAPVGSQKAFHAEGELATARAARSQGHLQMLSNVTSTSIEDVIEARGEPVWFQFYPTNKWSTASTMLKRAEDAGAKVVVLTVDLNSGSNRVLLNQFIRVDERDCDVCHSPGPDGWLKTKPMYAGTGAVEADWDMSSMTWDYIDRLRDATRMKIVVKGVVTAEDAKSCIERGVDAIYVSNHGGRAEASGWGSLENLPEVVATVNGRVPVLIDSGFRRGTDIFKALALGADAVCIGRAYIWGLAAFGQAGVEKVLDMLRAELRMVMGQMGARSIADIGAEHIGARG
ncbi:MAG: alpha-hydroxy-acid oxidizing protein [Woeseiaceae bacterium]|nr:alpha-hydroxy-acid oxidizing protein [Woeseiaceae bacterium]NIP21580.1 alpha-hydroxy-acid oxidizing protein [Woeseiaceae bacterium]NIS90554.1 alpha-hydroxy-acid oxidizing protein [Woeseiaceae bacterium]